MLLNELINLLAIALEFSGEVRIKAIKEFQNTVWNDTSIDNENLNDVLTDIAYILDFYEPNEEYQNESSNYYGNDALKLKIRSALHKLYEYYNLQ
jgi:hypothetical protein